MPGQLDGEGSRKRARKTTSEDDIVAQRLRGELSCAECRRLKLKCDKKNPCSSCVRRGCSQICPAGILAPGQGTRFILAGTDELHAKISSMGDRIRELEEALEPGHPLLQHSLEHASSDDAHSFDVQLTDSINALGTLTLSEGSATTFFGRSGGTETLLQAFEDVETHDPPSPSSDIRLPEHITFLSSFFPFPATTRPHDLFTILKHLPAFEHGKKLSDSYFTFGCLFFCALSREELMGSNGVLEIIYQSQRQVDITEDIKPAQLSEDLDPHTVAMFFMILSLGALLEPSLPPRNSAAQLYYTLAKAALSLKPCLEAPSISTIRAIGLVASYRGLTEGEEESGATRDAAWCIGGLAAKLSQAIGLHRDGANWSLSAQDVQRRRHLFWEIYALDASYSLGLGRPPTINLAYVDCAFPDESDTEPNISGRGSNGDGYSTLRYRFARDMVNSVAETTLSPSPVKYSSVMQVDRKIRTMPVPIEPHAQKNRPAEDPIWDAAFIRWGVISQLRYVALLYLHRTFYVQALMTATSASPGDPLADPMKGPFAHSFLACTAAASSIVKATAGMVKSSVGDVTLRMWTILFHSFSSAIILGVLPARVPKCALAPSALQDFMLAISIFEKAAETFESRRITLALALLRQVQKVALHSYRRAYPERVPCNAPGSSDTDNSDPELDLQTRGYRLGLFGGVTSTLERRKTPSTPRSSSSTIHSPNSGSSRAATDSPKSTSMSPTMAAPAHGDIYPRRNSSMNSNSQSSLHSHSHSRSGSSVSDSFTFGRVLPDGSPAIPDTGTSILDMFGSLMDQVGVNHLQQSPSSTFQPQQNYNTNAFAPPTEGYPTTNPNSNMNFGPQNKSFGEAQQYIMNNPYLQQAFTNPTSPLLTDPPQELTASSIGFQFGSMPHNATLPSQYDANTFDPGVGMDLGMDDSWFAFMQDSLSSVVSPAS